MLPIEMVRILSCFDGFGYDTGTTALSRHRVIRNFIYSMHILLVIIFTLYKIHITIEIYSWLNLVEVINESLQYSSAIYTYWIIILDSMAQRREHRHFWNVYQEICDRFCSDATFTQHYIRKFGGYFVFSTTLFISINLFSSIDSFVPIFMYLAMITICKCRIFYYLFCLETIYFQLQVIERKIIGVKYILRTSNQLVRLRWIREYYQCIYQMTVRLHKVFGWSQVAAILFCFYTLLTYLNWFNAHYHELNHIQQIRKSFFLVNSMNVFLI